MPNHWNTTGRGGWATWKRNRYKENNTVFGMLEERNAVYGYTVGKTQGRCPREGPRKAPKKTGRKRRPSLGVKKESNNKADWRIHQVHETDKLPKKK